MADDRRKAVCVGEWRAASAGGSPEHAAFFSNPQYALHLSAAQQDVEVRLSQAAVRAKAARTSGGGGPHPIGFVLLTAADADGVTVRKTLGAPGGPFGYSAVRAVCPSSFTAAASVSAHLKLERADAPFVLVPCTSEPRCEAAFSIEVRSNFGLSLLPLPADPDAVHDALGRVPPPMAPADDPEVVEAVEAALATVEAGELYTDADAPALVAGLDRPAGEWQRAGPSNLADASEGVLVHSGFGAPGSPTPTEPSAAGRAGAWLFGALAVVASRPDLLARCLPPGAHLRRGLLALRVWEFDTWKVVLTDTRLPCADGRPIAGECADAKQQTYALLAKALAKHAGGYAALRSGRVADLLVDLTGGVSHKLDLEPLPRDQPAAAKACAHVWADLVEMREARALVGLQQLAASSAGLAGGRHAACRHSVRTQHTYVLLDHAELSGGERLLCVRNPWGDEQPTWTGRWRAGAEAWTDARSGDEGRTALAELHERGSAYAGAAVRADACGVFWLEVSELISAFDRVYACHLFAEPSVRSSVHLGAWTSTTCGGCLNFVCSWRHNPQYLLELPRGGRVFVALTQRSAGGSAGSGASVGRARHLSVGVAALRGDGARRRLLAMRGREGMLGASPIAETREVSAWLDLPPSTSTSPHVLVPFTFEPGGLGDFKLFISSSEEFKLAPLAKEEEWHHAPLAGEWDATSGGVPNPENTEWFRNPQWLLHVDSTITLTLLLELDPPPPPDANLNVAIGCLLLRGASDADLTQIRPEHVVAQAGFARAAQVASAQLTLTPSPEPYRLLACTFDPGQPATFSLHIYSSAPLPPPEPLGHGTRLRRPSRSIAPAAAGAAAVFAVDAATCTSRGGSSADAEAHAEPLCVAPAAEPEDLAERLDEMAELRRQNDELRQRLECVGTPSPEPTADAASAAAVEVRAGELIKPSGVAASEACTLL